MNRRNAYRYIAVIENIKNVTSMSQIGMTKLSLLASLSESQQEEIQQKVDVEDVSVRELKEEIDKLRKEKSAAEASLKIARQQVQDENSGIYSVTDKNVLTKNSGILSSIRELCRCFVIRLCSCLLHSFYSGIVSAAVFYILHDVPGLTMQKRTKAIYRAIIYMSLTFSHFFKRSCSDHLVSS